MMKAGIYIRVSTKEQAEEGFSVDAQKNKAVAFCESQSWSIHDFYIDEGMSAKDMDRIDLKRLLIDAQSKKFDVIVVYKLDRLTRSVLDLYTIMKDLDKNDIKFKSVTEVYDTTTATGRLFLTLVAALAQWERENLAERVFFGMEEMAMQGKRPGGTMCYGYENAGDGALNIDDSQARIVRLIFDMYEKNQSIRTIQLFLEEKNVPPPKKHWSTTTINYLLRNPFYIGKIRWNLRKRGKGKTNAEFVVDGIHNPIISVEQFQRVQRLLDRRRSMAPVASTSDFIFSGIARCGKCGYALSGTSRTYKTVRTKYYACVNRQKNFKCDMPYIRENLLEKAVIEYTKRRTIEHNNDLGDLSDGHSAVTPETIEELNRKLIRLGERKKKFQNMYIDDLISKDDYLQRKTELEHEERSVLETIAELTNQGEEEDIEAHFLVDNFFEIYDQSDWNDKKTLLQEAVSSIVVKGVHKDIIDDQIINLEIAYN